MAPQDGAVVAILPTPSPNSAAVRIPDTVMVAAHIALNQTVEVREERGCIVIEPVRRRVYKLDELLSGIAANNQHRPIDMGAPVDKKVWQLLHVKYG